MVLSVASDVFLSFENVGNVLKQSAVVCVLALGQLLVILTRGIDLSVGANLSLSAWWERSSGATTDRPRWPSSRHWRPAPWSVSSTA